MCASSQQTQNNMPPKVNKVSTSTLESLAIAIGECGKSSAYCSGTLVPDDRAVTIKGVGPLRLPMQAKDVRELGDVAKPAPYGKRTQTIVDTAVRNSLEVDAGNVELSEGLRCSIDVELPVIERKLGLPPGQLKAELYKLLIYPTGGRFHKHRDSEKRKGMVGSLIVVLQSKFKGGTLIVWGKGSRERFEFHQASQGKTPEYVAFYADCEHEVERVTSGVRVCLAFNLIMKPAGKVTRDPTSAADPAIMNALADRLAAHPASPIVFPLEHHYTASGLKPDLLKGVDREINAQIKLAAEQLDCNLHYGQVSRHLSQFADDGSFGYGRRHYQSGPVDYDSLNIGEVYEDEIVIDAWKNASGKSVSLGDLPCDESMLACTTPVEQWKPTQQDYEGYTGNAGNTLDRWYHKSAIVIWPMAHHFEILVQMGLDYAIEQLLSMREKLAKLPDEEIEEACDHCQLLAEAIIDHWPSRLWQHSRGDDESQPALKQFAAELPKFDEPTLVNRFLKTLATRDWTLDLDKFVIDSCRRVGAEEIFPMLVEYLAVQPVANQYGRFAVEGLADRDASWICKLARDRKRGGIESSDLAKLIATASERLIGHANQLNGERYVPTLDVIQKPWERLVQAAITIGDERTVEKLVNLLQSAPTVFDVRKFQVPAANQLQAFVTKSGRNTPVALRAWIDTLVSFLRQATEREPAPPQDFTRLNHTGCDCPLCKEMQSFLADPAMEIFRITAREDHRQHLVGVIQSKQLDVSTRTEKVSNRYALVMTKTMETYERSLKQHHADIKLLASLVLPKMPPDLP